MEVSSSTKDSTTCATSEVLKGVCAYVEVRSNCENRSEVIAEELQKLGAQINRKLSGNVTHVVFKDGTNRTWERAKKLDIPLVSVLWVDSCKKTLEHVHENAFPVESPASLKENRLFPVKRRNFRSMQPKNLSEDFEESLQRWHRRRKRIDKNKNQNSSSFVESMTMPSAGSIPDIRTPPSVTASLLEPIRSIETDEYNFSEDICDLRRRLYNSARMNQSSYNILESSQTTDSGSCQRKLNTDSLSKVSCDSFARKRSKSFCSLNENRVPKNEFKTNKRLKLGDEKQDLHSPPKRLNKICDKRVSDRLNSSNLVSQSLNQFNSGSDEYISKLHEESQSKQDLHSPPKRLNKVCDRRGSDRLNSSNCVSQSSNPFNSSTDDFISNEPLRTKRYKHRETMYILGVKEDHLNNHLHPKNDPDENEEIDSVKPAPTKRDPQYLSKTDRSKNPAGEEGFFCESSQKPAPTKRDPQYLSKTDRSKNPAGEEGFFCESSQKPAPTKRDPQYLSRTDRSKNPAGEEGFFCESSQKPAPTKRDPQYLSKTDRSKNPAGEEGFFCESSQKPAPTKRDPQYLSRTDRSKNPGGEEGFFCESSQKPARTKRDPQYLSLSRTDLSQNPGSREPLFSGSSEENDNDYPRVKSQGRFQDSQGYTKAHTKTNPQYLSVSNTDRSQNPGSGESLFCRSSEENDNDYPGVKSPGRFQDPQDYLKARDNLDNLSESSSQSLAFSIHQAPSLISNSLNQNQNHSIEKEERNVSVLQKPIRKYLVMTSMSSSEQDLVKSVLKSLGGSVISDNVRKTTTHVICGNARRTLNLLKGLIQGCWLVSKQWIFKSMEAGRWIDERKYEMTEDYPVAKIYRQNKPKNGSLPIFQTCGSMFISSCTAPPKKDLVHLVQFCGGMVKNNICQADFYVGDEYNPSMLSVSPQWILDSITYQKALPFELYKLGQPKPQSPEF